MRPPLPQVYPDQRNQTVHHEEQLPSNYDYPDGSHLIPVIDQGSGRPQWISTEQQHRLYENGYFAHVPDEDHVIDAEVRAQAEFVQKARFEHSHGNSSFHRDETSRYDMPTPHHGHFQKDEVSLAPPHHQTMTQRYYQAPHDEDPPNFEPHDVKAPVDPRQFDLERRYTSQVEIREGFAPVKHLPQFRHTGEAGAGRKEFGTVQPVVRVRSEAVEHGEQGMVSQDEERMTHGRLQYPQEARKNFVPVEAVSKTNPFAEARAQPTHSSAPQWTPTSKVQSVVQMINQRNKPLNRPAHKEVSHSSQTQIVNVERGNRVSEGNTDATKPSSRGVGAQRTSTMDRNRISYCEDLRGDGEDGAKGGILKKRGNQPQEASSDGPAQGKVDLSSRVIIQPCLVIKNPPPAPPFPEGILKRTQKTPSKEAKHRGSHSDYSNSPTVSTDSALSSDDNLVSAKKQSVSQKCVSKEADLLLLYFKQHPTVLNFIGMQLPKGLVLHMEQLPDQPRVELIEICGAATVTPSSEPPKTTIKARANKEKVMRRASSKKVDKKAKRQSSVQASVRKPSEADSEATIPERSPNLATCGVAVGNTIISISQGPYPGFPEKDIEEDEQMRQHVLELKKQEMIEDFDDVSRQMVSREPSLSISSDDRHTLNGRVPPHVKQRLADSTSHDEHFSDGGARKQRAEPGPLTESQRAESRSGRFMKKSAAALIAKKQTSRNNSPSSGSSSSAKEKPANKKKVGYKLTETRIAAEIANLREREDELRRNRHQLGLPSLEDIVDIWRQGHGGRAPSKPGFGHQEHFVTDCATIGAPLRSARSFDHLHFSANEANTDDVPMRVAKSESFHHLQVENDCIPYAEEPSDRYGNDGIRPMGGTVSSGHLMMGTNVEVHGQQRREVQQRRHNFDHPNVQIKVRAGTAMMDRNGTLDSRSVSDSLCEEAERLLFRVSDQRGRLRRQYNQEFPAVRL
uniref:XS domain-containing protein n=1 Tax=Steinernema glaseri TaxID=37863 RepID=A0A1I7YZU1_9BILA